MTNDQPNNLASVDDWICMIATLEPTVCGTLRVLPTQPAMVGRTAAGGLLWRGRCRGGGLSGHSVGEWRASGHQPPHRSLATVTSP